MNRLIVFAGIAVCLDIGCSTVASKTIDIGALPPPYRVVLNGVADSVDEREIAAGSDAAQRILAWLAANQTGWTRTYVTYAPGRVVRGDSFSLNFRGDICVINCQNGQF